MEKEDRAYVDALTELRNLFPKQMMLSVTDMALVRGESKQSIYNGLSKGSYPIACNRRNGKPRWTITNVARYLAEVD